MPTLIALVAALTGTSAAADRVVVRLDADQAVNIDDFRADPSKPAAQGRVMSQVQVMGPMGDERATLVGWLGDWGAGKGAPVHTVVEFVGYRGDVVRTIELDHCVPARYVPALRGVRGTVISEEAFFFSGEMIRDTVADEDATHTVAAH